MAAGGTFSTLCRLAELRDPAITAGARAILHLVPTEPAVSDALETLCAPPGRAGDGGMVEVVRQMLGGGQSPATGLRLVYNLEVSGVDWELLCIINCLWTMVDISKL